MRRVRARDWVGWWVGKVARCCLCVGAGFVIGRLALVAAHSSMDIDTFILPQEFGLRL